MDLNDSKNRTVFVFQPNLVVGHDNMNEGFRRIHVNIENNIHIHTTETQTMIDDNKSQCSTTSTSTISTSSDTVTSDNDSQEKQQPQSESTTNGDRTCSIHETPIAIVCEKEKDHLDRSHQ